MKRYDAYLFDLDGTLIDTVPDLNRALNHTLEQASLPTVDESLTRHWIGHGVRAMLTAAFTHAEIDPSVAEYEGHVDVFLEHYKAHIADVSRPYEGAVEVLETLRRDEIPCAVVTNKIFELTEPLLAALDLTRFFAAIVAGDTAPEPKPAAAPALLACERLGVAPADTLFIGDSAADVGCARAAGCPVVVCEYGYNHGIAPESLGADRVIATFLDLV